MIRILLAVGIVIGLSGCSYLGQAVKQAHLFTLQKYAPAQRVYKQMLEGDTYFVFGKVKNATFFNEEALAVVAISDRYQENEVVDIGHFSRASAVPGAFCRGFSRTTIPRQSGGKSLGQVYQGPSESERFIVRVPAS